MAGLLPLVASSALEIGVVALAGWELWKLRTPKAPPSDKDAGREDDPPPSSRR